MRADGNVPADTGEQPADTRLRALAAEANCFLDTALCYPGAFLDNSYLNVLFLKVDWEAATGRKRVGATLLLPEVRTQGVRHPGTHQ